MSTFKEKYDIHESKLKDLKAKALKVKSELQMAYDYKDNVYSKMKMADEDITKKQNEYYQVLNEVTSELTNLKAEFDNEISNLKLI